MLDSLNRFHFEPEAAASSNVPYYMQGVAGAFDGDMERRNQIRSSRQLKSAILQFWSTCGLMAEDSMDKSTYTFVHVRISAALAPELSEGERAAATQEDWQDDAHGQDTITFDDFFHGMTGIVDMWSDVVDELAYVIFANKLYRRITKLAPASSAHRNRAVEAAPTDQPKSWQTLRKSMSRRSFRSFRDLEEIAPLAPIVGDGAGSIVTVAPAVAADAAPAIGDGATPSPRVPRVLRPPKLSDEVSSIGDRQLTGDDEASQAPSRLMTPARSNCRVTWEGEVEHEKASSLPPPPPPVRVEDDETDSDDEGGHPKRPPPARPLRPGGTSRASRLSFSLKLRSPAGWHTKADGVSSPFATPRTLLRRRSWNRTARSADVAPPPSAPSPADASTSRAARPPPTPSRVEGGAHSDDEDELEALLAPADLWGESVKRVARTIEERRRWRRMRAASGELTAAAVAAAARKEAPVNELLAAETRRVAAWRRPRPMTASASTPALPRLTRL